MAFVDRNPDTTIKGVYRRAQFAGQEQLPDTDSAVVAYLNPPPLTVDQLAAKDADLKQAKAILLVMRTYCNALKAGTYTAKTVAEVRDDFITAWKSLP